MFGLSLIDIGVIVVYFGIVVGIGFWASRHIRGEEDFFLAGRRFGKFIQTFAAFGQGTSADNAVGVATTTFSNGASGVWSSMLYLFATPIYWFTSVWMRRLRLLTLGDFFLERYGSQRMAAVYALIGAIGMMSFIALGFSAMSKTIIAITPKPVTEFTAAEQARYRTAYDRELQSGNTTAAELLSLEELAELDRLERIETQAQTSQEQTTLTLLQKQRQAVTISYFRHSMLVWTVCLIVIVYAAAGGLEAAFLTDTLQGMFIIVLSVILIPFAWAKINAVYGGSGSWDALSTIHAKLPDSFFEVFGSPHTIDFTWYYIIALSAMATLTVVVQPNQLIACGSARGEYEARYGFVVGSYLKRVCTVFWGVFGLAAIVLYGSTVYHPDLVWGHATRDLLGPVNIGLVGLMVACLMAALQSTADCLMLTCSSLLTHNLYHLMVPNRSQSHYIWVGRVFGALTLLGAAWIALQFDTILQILKFIWEMNVALVPAFWLGIKWRRANRWGAWASMVFGIFAFLVLPLAVPAAAPSIRTMPMLLKCTTPAPLVRTYRASEADARIREMEIAHWETSRNATETATDRPEPLEIGQVFTRTYQLPTKSIFWTQGVGLDELGRRHGKGSLSLELVLLDRLGWDLSRNAYALNETIRILIRICSPMLLMLVVCLLTRADDERLVQRFFARMRTRVAPDPKEDADRLARAIDNPGQGEGMLLFPGTKWEFYRWNREDTVGFVLSVLAVFMVLGLMQALLTVIGKA
ncbi:MAG: sodium:solute symporter family protein [Planctomycetaceae bacterium]|nr:MAG: sodium:solute symporter family protein [Planctomycetaceae bacterium]